MPRICFSIIYVFVVTNVACTSVSSSPSKIAPIPPGPEPEWLTILYPKPSQVTSIDIYNTANWQSHSGSLPAPKVPASVCVEIWAEELIEAGDYWEWDDVVSRITVFVDGIKRVIAPEILDGIVLHTMTDLEGRQVASVGGPYAFCASAAIEVGIHQIDISFQKSSGELKEFSWTFSAVEGSIPTSTPLPTPLITNQGENIPDYLRAVYPPPGKQIPLPSNSEFWSDVIDIWSFLKTSEQDFVCFALIPSKLYALGALPYNRRDWPDRIYFNIDHQSIKDWYYPAAGFYEEEWISTHCIETNLETGKHTATIFIDPFDKELVVYSWIFTKSE